MTKLKDLQSSGSTSGIKRVNNAVVLTLLFVNIPSQFFESTTDTNSRKRVKVEDVADLPELEESMPGYHEFDETDCNAHAHDDEPEIDVYLYESELTHPTLRPPQSTSHTGLSSNNRQLAGPSGPNSEATNIKSKQFRNTSNKVPVATQTCPICTKVLDGDNAGLNAHIDFCLSRGTIMQAQMEASKMSSSLQSQLRGGQLSVSADKNISKPRSHSKRS